MSSVGVESVGLETGINSLYLLLCTGLLPLVLIGIALFYSGLTQRRSAFTMLAVPILISPIIILDWYIWGYSLCYATASNKFIGSLKFAVLRQLKHSMKQTYTNTRGSVLVMNHFLFNLVFKLICGAFTFPGCIAERGRVLPMLLFAFIWSVIIYNPVTYWFWNVNGWLYKMDVLDFAGGNCIHIVCGFTCLAYSYILGPRNPKALYNYRHSNTGYLVVGTFLLTSGWVGFVAGCEYKFSYNSIPIMVSTILSASSAAVVWATIDYIFSKEPLVVENDALGQDSDLASATSKGSNAQKKIVTKRKVSMISVTSGIVSGLVVVTPGGGYISSNNDFWKPIIFGIVGAALSNLSTRLKYYFNIDDALDVFAIHGVAGIVGSLLTGIFADKLYDSKGGWAAGHWKQFGIQLLGLVVTSAYVFIMTVIFLYIIDLIPGCHLRIDKNYNRREREKKQSSNKDEHMELESQVSASVGEKLPEDSKQDYWEQVELLGSDNYEFSSEFMMDFIEFIKVIRPEDYSDVRNEEILLSHSESVGQYNSGNGYEQAPEAEFHSRKYHQMSINQ
ncbi:hypothetical protein CANMA_000999 [Candida margitis]|uniref:uncharacterized protein n=1 Tax=Candida margitis TaxID=1775924 RepID=UPI002225B9B7|nr:uncharacterized protein CANMA_000999 [Candida margitis]KAI5969959.1 hypothetical protein CANMA_000999 [Candida margitis]